MIDDDEIVYSLNISDIQTVAIEEFGRKLTENEILQISNLIEKKIGWYDIILDSIYENKILN